jgi:uncharacterized membrane protein
LREEQAMSELIVVAFDDEFKADEVLLDLTRRQEGYQISQEDAAVVIRKVDGQLLIRHVHPLTAAMGAHGTFWGLLLGILLLNPLAGIIIGGTVGAAAGSLRHAGIDDAFIKELGASARPGTSILFILDRQATPSSALRDLERFDGRVLRTSFGYAGEERLREALTKK